MYGLVNQAIQELVTNEFGAATWNRIKTNAGWEKDSFVAQEMYPDPLTYGLVGAICEESGLSAQEVLYTFGMFWPKFVVSQGFGHMLQANGPTFEEFVANLDQFHSRLTITYPNFLPPTFEHEQVDEETIHLRYFSEREGLAPMLHGILVALGDFFNRNIHVEFEPVDDHHLFVIKLNEADDGETIAGGEAIE